MKDLLLKLLAKIYTDIESHSSISLLGGDPGVTLFKIYYLKHLKGGDLSEIESDIQRLSELCVDDNDIPSFCSGQAGINWFFNFLTKQGYIDFSDYEIIGEIDQTVANACLRFLKEDFYDFLHGATGIAYHLLYTDDDLYSPVLKSLFEKIKEIMGEENPVLYQYNFDLMKLDRDRANPSLSHGMTSVLKLCMECYKKGIYAMEAKSIAKNIVDFLMTNINHDHSLSYFPYIYDLKTKDNRPSRLAWCYGDLTIAYTVYQYALLFVDVQLEEAALQVLRHSATRRTDIETSIVDAGICHGTAGVAHIYGKLFKMTKEYQFSEARDYWFDQTIQYGTFPDGIGGYKKFDSYTNTWVKDSGLLEGAAGIGLAVISYLFDDYEWDYCLMLND